MANLRPSESEVITQGGGGEGVVSYSAIGRFTLATGAWLAGEIFCELALEPLVDRIPDSTWPSVWLDSRINGDNYGIQRQGTLNGNNGSLYPHGRVFYGRALCGRGFGRPFPDLDECV